MLDKLEGLETRYQELDRLLASPDLYDDPKNAAKLLKEQKDLNPIIMAYRELKKANQSLSDSLELMRGTLEPDFKEMVQEEIDTAKADMERLEEELKILLLPKDENDDKSVIIEIRGGAGGDEAALFANSLYRMYTMYAEARKWKTEVMNANETELGGYKEITFSVSGEGAYSRLKYESGVHRVQRVPETESQGRVHTSTVTVAVLPEVGEVELEINPADLQVDTYRSSGAGGQHVNKTESAIRITHLPSGIVVSCQTERSQFQNRDTAMKMLRSKLMEIKEREHLDKVEDIKGDQKKIEWGSQIRSYVFMPYTLAKDHRTGFENGNITAVMDGDLDGFINAYLTAAATGNWAK